MDSIHDPNVGIIFDPRSLINALTGLILDHRDSCLIDLDTIYSSGHSV